MTNKISTTGFRAFKASATVIALLTSVVLAACSGGSESGSAAGGAHAAPASSSAGLPQGHIGAGEALAATRGEATGQSCIDCHGSEGNAPIDDTYPKLGGQYADYLGHALQAYRSGDRDHALMSNQAKHLTDQQIADLAAYFASRESQLRDLHNVH